MALQGAGDPRWVVREREDGRNVNSWHWEDKDVTTWAKDRLTELIAPAICSYISDGTTVAVKKIGSIDGDATLYNRKGVLKVLYDLKISGEWSSCQEEEDDRTYGDFKFELFDEEPEFNASINSKSKGDSALRSLFLSKVTPIIRDQCLIFIREMHAGAGQKLDGVSLPTKKKVTETKVTDFLRSGMDQKVSNKVTKATCKLEIDDIFACTPTDIYLALTDVARLQVITRAKAISEPTVGGKVDLLGGTVVGKYTSLKIGAEIGMEWKLKNWGDDANSGNAMLKIEDVEGKTKLNVAIDGVPNEHKATTEGFWRVQLFQAMKVVMGWGSASHFL